MQGQDNIMLCQLLVYSHLYLSNLCLVLCGNRFMYEFKLF